MIMKAIAALVVMLSLAGISQARTPPEARLTVSITNLTVSPATVTPGGTETIGADFEASAACVRCPVEVSIQPTGTTGGQNIVANVTFAANKTVPETGALVIPTTAKVGSWTVAVAVYSPNWRTQYGIATKTFTVAPPVVTPPPVITPPPPVTSGTEAPGPSAALYAAPFYQCQRNLYVATTGNDSNAGTQISPWLTIQHADAGRVAGDCVNVAPGTYQGFILDKNGGSAPTPTGYVVYRCETLDGCHVLAPAAGHLWLITSPANFIVIDGFEIDGNGTTAAAPDGLADQCIGSSWDDNRWFAAPNNDSSHHIWVLNSVVHHCNLSGISFSNKEWIYAIHNKVYHNSWTSGYEGSGIGMVVWRCIEAGNQSCVANTNTPTAGSGTYTPSGMDLTYAPPYHGIISWNNVTDNSEAHDGIACGSQTDGNGIILDTWLDEATLSIPYPYQTLVYGNVSYANGGRGIHVFATSNVTVANNTAYGNGTDTCISAYYLADLSQAGGSNNVWVNNVAFAVLTTPTGQCQYCGGRNAALVAGAGRGQADNNNTYRDFVLGGANPTELFNNAATAFVPANNKVGADPSFVSPPSNLALKPGSPAIGYAVPGYGALSDAGACAANLTACP